MKEKYNEKEAYHLLGGNPVLFSRRKTVKKGYVSFSIKTLFDGVPMDKDIKAFYKSGESNKGKPQYSPLFALNEDILFYEKGYPPHYETKSKNEVRRLAKEGIKPDALWFKHGACLPLYSMGEIKIAEDFKEYPAFRYYEFDAVFTKEMLDILHIPLEKAEVMGLLKSKHQRVSLFRVPDFDRTLSVQYDHYELDDHGCPTDYFTKKEINQLALEPVEEGEYPVMFVHFIDYDDYTGNESMSCTSYYARPSFAEDEEKIKQQIETFVAAWKNELAEKVLFRLTQLFIHTRYWALDENEKPYQRHFSIQKVKTVKQLLACEIKDNLYYSSRIEDVIPRDLTKEMQKAFRDTWRDIQGDEWLERVKKRDKRSHKWLNQYVDIEEVVKEYLHTIQETNLIAYMESHPITKKMWQTVRLQRLFD